MYLSHKVIIYGVVTCCFLCESAAVGRRVRNAVVLGNGWTVSQTQWNNGNSGGSWVWVPNNSNNNNNNNNAIQGNGVAGSDSRDVGSFNQLNVFSAIELHLKQGSFGPVAIEGDSNLLPNVEVTVQGSVLVVGMKTGSYNPTMPIKVTVSCPAIKAIQTSGASTVNAESELSCGDSDFLVQASGSSGIFLQEVTDAPNVKISAAGSSHIQGITGSTGHLMVEATGASRVGALKLSAEFADVSAAGASSVYLNAQRISSAIASGASQIYYTGNPELGRIMATGVSYVGPSRG